MVGKSVKTLVALFLLAVPLATSALSVDQIIVIKRTINSTATPELPAVVGRLVQEARPADRNEVAKLAIQVITSKKPGAVDAALAAIPTANRPPVTPGNTHGNRPTVPPGLNKYASP